MSPARFKAIRQALGWSAAKMGQEMGVHGVSIFRWENGTRAVEGPAAKLAERIALDHNLDI